MTVFSIMFRFLSLFCVCISIIDFWFVVTMLLIFLRNIEKDRSREKTKLPTVSLFKANHGKNLNISLPLLSNIYINCDQNVYTHCVFFALDINLLLKTCHKCLFFFNWIHKHPSFTAMLTVVLIFEGNAH